MIITMMIIVLVVMIVMMIIIVIITLKAAMQDFLQSTHCATPSTYAQVAMAQLCANPVQHVWCLSCAAGLADT